MRSTVRIVVGLVVILLIVVGATALRRTRSVQNAKAASPREAPARAVPVLAENVTPRDMPVYLRGLGSVTAFNTVTVKTRVDGQIVQINFREGQDVKQGDLLIVIDPRPFEVQLHQAEANLARDEAQIADARLNLERYRALYQDKVIAKQQLDTQASLVGQIEGNLGADRAAIENAKLQLTYSRITAPISGRIGLRLVDIGNMVHASDANGLLVITQLHPIAVLFTLPEDYIPDVLRQMRKGSLDVEAYSRDDKEKIATGKLLTLNNQIDPTTGTNKFKAVFQNEDQVLWPNEFVNIRLLLETKHNALTVPVAAIQHGTQGTFAYVVKPDSTVEARVLKIGVTEGNVAAVDDGLQPGEMVVTDGQDKLQPGAKVEVQRAGNRPGGGQGAAGHAPNSGSQGAPQAPGNRGAQGSRKSGS